MNKSNRKNTFADRLQVALDKEGFPPKNRGRIQLLAEMMGISHRGASKWINGESLPSVKKYLKLAVILNVAPTWLKTGRGTMSEEIASEPQTNNDFANVPVYALEDVLSDSKQPTKFITCTLEASEALFALQLETEAMSPRFPQGSIVIFDSGKQANDGDFVLVDHDNYPAPIFRQLLIIGSARYLNAHNPKFDRLVLDSHSHICGTMVQILLVFQRAY